MMNNLFSMFDPSTMSMSFSWLIPFCLIMSPMFCYQSKIQSSYSMIINSIMNEMMTVSNNKHVSMFCVALFSTILILNMVALLPFTFTINSQLNVVFSSGLILWLAIFSHNFINKFNSTMSHLVPIGTPSLLMPIMVLIELTSSLIRPITLSVRLMANLTAGHLLMHLLSSFTIYSNCLIPLLPVSLILTTLEIGVAMIQAYIFSILLTLYSSEIH